MDPITALSLACTILTFIDYANRIVTGTYEVFQSATGTTDENAHIDTIIDDLHKVTADLDSDLVGKSKHGKALKGLASKCEKLSDDLLHLLEKLTVSGNHSTWKGLKVKITSMRKEKEIAGMEKRLGEYRLQILLRLTLILKSGSSTFVQNSTHADVQKQRPAMLYQSTVRQACEHRVELIYRKRNSSG
jgi:hypothetical protein